MKETLIAWNEGSGNIVATYTGEKDAPISFSSDTENEGIDRSQKVTISTINKSLSIEVTINQVGKREMFLLSDGELILSDNQTFNVLK